MAAGNWVKAGTGQQAYAVNLDALTSLQVVGSGTTWHVATSGGLVFAATYTSAANAQAAIDTFVGTYITL